MTGREVMTMDDYVDLGLRSNRALQRQQREYKQSALALRIARGLFLPEIGLRSRHTRGGGGRIFTVPTGDLINPVYGTLNQLTASTANPTDFPTDINNHIFDTIRREEHETKLRVSVPLINLEYYHRYQAEKQKHFADYANLHTFRLELVHEIQTACYEYIKTALICRLFEETFTTVRENLRYSRDMVSNGQATEEVIFRAQTEVNKVEENLSRAEYNRTQAAYYLNFLVNQKLDIPVTLDPGSPELVDISEVESQFSIDDIRNRRWDVAALSNSIHAAHRLLKSAKSRFYPSIDGVYEIGYEGKTTAYYKDEELWIGGIWVNWNFFRGFRDKNEINQLKLKKYNLESEMAELKDRIELEYRSKVEELHVLWQAIHTSQARCDSTKSTFDIVHNKLNHGQASQPEFIEARTEYTTAGIRLVVTKYNYLIAFSDLEHITAVINR